MTDPTITARISLDSAKRDALARATRAAQELTAAIDALSEPAPRWAVDPDDSRRIIHADSLPDWDAALDQVLRDHGIPTSPTSDATAAPETSAAPDAGTGMGHGVSGPQNGTQPDPLDETDHRDRLDRNQDPWVRCANGKWHLLTALACPSNAGDPHCWWRSLPELNDVWGPLTFAPEGDS